MIMYIMVQCKVVLRTSTRRQERLLGAIIIDSIARKFIIMVKKKKFDIMLKQH